MSDLFLAVAVPATVFIVWLFSALKHGREGAKFRHYLGAGLLTYGILSSVAYIPLAFVTWGTPQAAWALILFFSGLLSIATAGAIGLMNLLLNRGVGSTSSFPEES